MVTRIRVQVRGADAFEPPAGAKVVRGTVFRDYAELVLLLTDPPAADAEEAQVEGRVPACVWGT